MKQEADGTVPIYFAPKPPAGTEATRPKTGGDRSGIPLDSASVATGGKAKTYAETSRSRVASGSMTSRIRRSSSSVGRRDSGTVSGMTRSKPVRALARATAK